MRYRMIEAKPMMLLPPAPGKCQTCAVEHSKDLPHDAASLFYAVKFKMDHGRDPTWEDAMSHCDDRMKAHWIKHLTAAGIDVKSIYTRGKR